MTNLELGLSEKEAQRRFARNGPNVIKEHKAKSWPEVFLTQLNDPLIYVLAVAAGVSILLGEYGDAAIIVVVVLLNAMVGTIQEGKAKKALDCLRDLQSPKALVIRDGRKREIEAARLVEGDLVCLETGARVPADLLLVETAGLRTEESALTGESLPVEKKAVPVGESLPAGKKAMPVGEFLPEGKKAVNAGAKLLEEREAWSGWKGKVPDPGINRRDVAYMSTMVTEGTGKGIVIGTGMKTEIGRIADMIRGEKQELTPLQKRLGELGTVLSLLSLFLCAALFGIAVMQQRDVIQMLLTAISLAVAAVPEGLPAVVTICLALSVTRMVKAGTIVRRLPCVEALGAVNVVCSDKTGTLTQNRMKAELGYWDDSIKSLREGAQAPPAEFLRGFLLCNNAGEEGGEPTERALLEMGSRFDVSKARLEKEMPRVSEIPFSSETRQMVTCHVDHGRELWICKGAPDEVLKKCSGRKTAGKRESLTHQARQEILQAAAKMAESGYRVLGLATQKCEEARQVGLGNAPESAEARQAGPGNAPERNWTFLGMAAMGDAPRPEAAGAVETLKTAGVDTVMITGDHPGTALSIGKRLGIAEREAQTITGERLARLSEEELSREISRRDLRIFARVSPAQKVQIVKALQKQGKIVAMTGDGVNDAPSLKAADVGIAMGKNGTDVAKEAADLVLTDDHFATIGRAVEEGRGIYENIRKSVIFLLSSNLGELLTMFAAVAGGFLSPLKSCHVLWINLITDSLPALALGTDPCDGKALMKEKPRSPKESILSRGGLACICFYGTLIATISLAAFCLPVFPLLQEAEGLGEMLTVLRGGLTKEAFLTRGQTYAFTVLGMSQLFHAIGMRDVNKSVFRMNHLENKVMILATLAGFALQLAVTEIPFLTVAFGTSALSLKEWGMLLVLASVPVIAHEAVLMVSALFE